MASNDSYSRKQMCWSGTNCSLVVSSGLLLDVQFYFPVLKFTLENEIAIVMIESRIFVFRERTHNCTPCIFDGISMKSLKMSPKKPKYALNNKFITESKSLRENSNSELFNIIAQSATLWCTWWLWLVPSHFMIQVRKGNIGEIWKSDKN